MAHGKSHRLPVRAGLSSSEHPASASKDGNPLLLGPGAAARILECALDVSTSPSWIGKTALRSPRGHRAAETREVAVSDSLQRHRAPPRRPNFFNLPPPSPRLPPLGTGHDDLTYHCTLRQLRFVMLQLARFVIFPRRWVHQQPPGRRKSWPERARTPRREGSRTGFRYERG
jgi:hypothetical protein